jgi:hypothetical protein
MRAHTARTSGCLPCRCWRVCHHPRTQRHCIGLTRCWQSNTRQVKECCWRCSTHQSTVPWRCSRVSARVAIVNGQRWRQWRCGCGCRPKYQWWIHCVCARGRGSGGCSVSSKRRGVRATRFITLRPYYMVSHKCSLPFCCSQSSHSLDVVERSCHFTDL